MRYRRNENGFVLPATLLLVVILSILGYSVLYLGQTQEVESIKDLHSAQAFALAEAGLHRALWQVRSNPSWTAGWDGQSLGNGAYTVTVEAAPDLGASWSRIRSTGAVRGISRTVIMSIDGGAGWPAPFQYALFWANPETQYSSLLEFENHVDIFGDVFAYGSVEFSPGAGMGDGWFLYTTGSASGTGFTLGELPDPLPERLLVDTTSYRDLIDQASTAPGGDWVVEKKETRQLNNATVFVNGKADIKQQAIIQGPGTIVAANEINIGNKAQVIDGVTLISGGGTTVGQNTTYTGEVDGSVIYSDGEIKIKNHTSLENAIIIGSDLVALSNNTDVHGIICAGTAKMENSSYILGSLYANAFDGDSMTNRATVEYDASVLDYEIPEGFPEGQEITIGTWAEE